MHSIGQTITAHDYNYNTEFSMHNVLHVYFIQRSDNTGRQRSTITMPSGYRYDAYSQSIQHTTAVGLFRLPDELRDPACDADSFKQSSKTILFSFY